MVDNITVPLEHEQSIGKSGSNQLHHENQSGTQNPKNSVEITHENQTRRTSSSDSHEFEKGSNIDAIERLIRPLDEAGPTLGDENSPTIYTEDDRENFEEWGPEDTHTRAFRYLNNASHLDDTEFATKIELTADYQGSSILSISNEHYGSASNIIKTTVKKITTSKFVKENEEDGIQDGWLVKRHEEEAHAIIQLGANGRVCGIDIDTTGYKQCAPLQAALYGRLGEQPRSWTRILPSIELRPNSHNFFETKNNSDIYDRILITLTPGGGIHRLRIFGDVVTPTLPSNTTINLSSTILGSQIVQKPATMLRKDVPNLILGRADSSHDGWICPRNYNDDEPQYTVIKLASEGIIDRIVVDTTHFIGNAAKSVLLQGCSINIDDETSVPDLLKDADWVNLLDAQDLTHQNLYPNMLQTFPCVYRRPLTHVRVRPIPDGGIQQILFKGRLQQKDKILPENPNSGKRKRKQSVDQNTMNKRTITTRSYVRLKSASPSLTTLQTQP